MKYQMMEEQMIRMIESGQGVDAGGRFLSERTIAEMFGVSRSTAQKGIPLSAARQRHVCQAIQRLLFPELHYALFAEL